MRAILKTFQLWGAYWLAAVSALLFSAVGAFATEVSVTFRDVGYGTFGGSQLQSIASPKSLLALPGISQIEFVQDTTSGRFEAIQTGCNSQGNDVAVTVRLTADNTLINNTSNGHLTFLACVNWLDQPGGKIEGFGFMLPIGSSFTIDYNDATPDVTFTRTATTTGTNMFADLTVSGGSKTYLFDGTTNSSFIGSANFKPAALVDALNQYDASTSLTPIPNLQLVKTASLSGDVITYTYTITNTGNVDLTTITLAEVTSANQSTTGGTAFTGTGTAPVPTIDAAVTGTADDDLILQVAESWTYSATYTLTQADKDAGGVTNQAYATGYYATGTTTATDLSDPAGVGSNTTVTPFTQTPAMSITKTAVTTGLSSPVVSGNVMSWTVEVTNTGNVTLSSVTLADNLSAAANYSLSDAALTAARSGTNSTDTSFDPGDIWTWTVSYTLTQADIDAGALENVAAVTATPPNALPVLGDIQVYSGTNATASTSGISPSTGNGVVTPLTAAPAITGVKTVAITSDTGATGLSAGDTLTYTIVATNSGNVTLSSVAVQSDTLTRADTNSTAVTTPLTGASFTTSGSTTLAPGESATFTATYVVTQADIDAGGLSNTATVTGTPPTGNAVTDVTDDGDTGTGNTGADPTVLTVTAAPELTISKTVDDSALADGVRVGDVLSYTITVANAGNVTLSNVTLYDDGTNGSGLTGATGGALSLTSGPTAGAWPGGTADTLAPGASVTYTATFALTQAAIEAGGVENIATVTATPPTGSAISAQSKLAGNSSVEGAGTPTPTGFPGEISGTVKEYLAGVEGVTVYLLKETTPGSGTYDYALDGNGQQISTVTDAQGGYVFLGLPPGTYGIEFLDPNRGSDLLAESADATVNREESPNRITAIAVSAGAVKIEQDAFFIDPSGVVYDSETFLPISGATVTLLYNGTQVPDSWLNLTLGNANGSLTDGNGVYSYILDPTTAQTGTYTLVVTKAGYQASVSVPPATGPYEPALGGGVEEVVPDAVPSSSTVQSYYMSFSFTFNPSSAAQTSNGVINNHIPLDILLVPDVKDEVIDILKQDLAATMTQQAGRMSGFAKDALDRLKSRDANSCLAAATEELRKEPLHFVTASAEIGPESAAVLDRVANTLNACPETLFEIAGHTDSDGDEAYNLALSQARSAAVASALVQRGVAADRMTRRGYGETRPIADEVTAESKALNRRVEFVALEAEVQAAPCANTTTASRDLNASVNEAGTNIDGSYHSESRDCATDSWRIIDGSVSYLSTGDNLDQGMFSLSLRRERFVDDNHLRGRFVGVYASRSAVSGNADGSILGFGLNGGIYGANRMQNGLFLDYYLGIAGGRHRFDLDFARTGGTITATGYYKYVAGFAGVALSGETHKWGKTLAPRVGVDLAYSPGGTGAITAARGQIRDSSDLTVPSVSGARVFAEVQIGDLTGTEGSTAAFTPRVLCAQEIGANTVDCGFGAALEWSYAADEDGTYWSVTLDGEHVGTSTTTSLSAQYAVPLAMGQISGGWQLGGSGDVGVQSRYELKF